MIKNYPFYEHKEIYTIKELVEFFSSTYKDNTALMFAKNKKEDVSISYIQFRDDIESFGTYLFSKGYKDCKIAVFGENSYEWILTHFSVTCGRNVIVPIDKELESDDVKYLLTDSNCKLLVYSNDYKDVVENLLSDYDIDTINMKDINNLIAEGRSLVDSGNLNYINTDIQPDDLASIVYTSGTTGKPKGVMLSHRNFASDTYGAAKNVLLTGSTILVLPLHHTFGLVASVFAELFYGMPVYINKSLKNLLSDFQKVKPQHLFAVPLIVETIYKNIWASAKKQGKDKALKVLIKISNSLIKCGIDLRKILFKSVISAFGGNIDLIVSGGAPIENKYIEEFKSFAITVLNGYGITECGPVVAVNRNQFVVKDSVGLPLCCNDIKISDDGEVLVKGSNVMIGYYNNQNANNEAFIDGWFKTGDIGFLDEFGALHIAGRKKNLIILSNGENIAAEELESYVYQIPYVKEVIVYGENDIITAEIYLDEDYSDALDRINNDIANLNITLPLVKNIGSIKIRDTEFPKTTTKKIKRNYIEV